MTILISCNRFQCTVRKSIPLQTHEKLSKSIIPCIRKSLKTLYERSLFRIYFFGHFLTKDGYKNLLTDDLYHDFY